MLEWRNWQTRMVEGHVERSMGVQVPLRAPSVGVPEAAEVERMARIIDMVWMISLVAHIAQSVEHVLGKDEVSGSSPDVGSIVYR